MDFLDPKKQRAHMIRLFAGYALIALAILIATLILVYRAYGFGLAKDGQVIQNGLVFLSSRPSDAEVYLDGSRYKNNTNLKLQLESGQYTTQLRREGYRNWQRTITVDGGSLQHFDYPLLVPNKIITANIKSYTAAPNFTTQSPDRRWLLVQQDMSPLNFDIFDLADPKKVNSEANTLILPENLITTPRSGEHSWKLIEWANDNRRLLVQHSFTGGTEYVLINRDNVEESVNLTKSLTLGAGWELTLRDKKYDKYYVLDPAAHTLGTTSLDEKGQIAALLTQVLAYKTYGSDIVLYVTDKGATAADKVVTMLLDDGQSYRLREHGAAPPYLIDIAQYSGDWYTVVGSSGDSKVYVYKNPQRIRKASQTAALVPVRILRVPAPNYVAFSSNTQYIMASNGTSFATYDAEYDKGYSFTASMPLDLPASHATWMDSQRLTYVSGGKLAVVEYDNANPQILMPASSNYLPFFSRDYQTIYSLAPTPSVAGAPSTGMTLTSASLLIPADQ